MGNRKSISPPQCNYQVPRRTVRILTQCKICGFIVCIVSTIIYIFLPLVIIYLTPTTILMPSFVTGYIIVNAVGIIENFSNRHNVIVDICLNTLGMCANLYCGIDLMYDWILWLIKRHDSFSPNYYGLEYFLLILTLGINTATMIIQLLFIKRTVERRHIPRQT